MTVFQTLDNKINITMFQATSSSDNMLHTVDSKIMMFYDMDNRDNNVSSSDQQDDNILSTNHYV